jgi:hypothetical protein
LPARSLNRRVGVVHHQFLAESIDEMLGASGDCYFQRHGLLHAHGVADAVSPQTVAGGDYEFVGVSRLHVARGQCLRVVAVDVRQRYEFVEHTEVEQQEHCRRVG